MRDIDRNLIDAVLKGDIERVKELIAAGADVNAVDNRGHTAVIIAAIAGYTNIVNFLLACENREDMIETESICKSWKGYPTKSWIYDKGVTHEI